MRVWYIGLRACVNLNFTTIGRYELDRYTEQVADLVWALCRLCPGTEWLTQSRSVPISVSIPTAASLLKRPYYIFYWLSLSLSLLLDITSSPVLADFAFCPLGQADFYVSSACLPAAVLCDVSRCPCSQPIPFLCGTRWCWFCGWTIGSALLPLPFTWYHSR